MLPKTGTASQTLRPLVIILAILKILTDWSHLLLKKTWTCITKMTKAAKYVFIVFLRSLKKINCFLSTLPFDCLSYSSSGILCWFQVCIFLDGGGSYLIGAMISLSKWIQYWALRYQHASPRKEKKIAHLKSTYNPWSYNWGNQMVKYKKTFLSKLEVKTKKREDTYLADFLSSWLCTFVFPSKEGNFIEQETFKTASRMTSGRRVSLAVLILASIYND